MKLLYKTTNGIGLSILLFLMASIQINAQNKVFINNKQIPHKTLNYLANYYQIKIQDGHYWYDNLSGAWGISAGPTMGFVLPFMKLGGHLKSNASNGNTNVFVNGRELHYQDVIALQKIINVIPGRYWLDAKGNGGYIGMLATFNLRYLARKKRGSSLYRNSYTGLGTGSGGGTFYMIGDGVSVITGN
jgi:hypothetical protein